ncbi:MAG: hypothetical protein AAGG68_06635 [Bacteroidota bacterium]
MNNLTKTQAQMLSNYFILILLAVIIIGGILISGFFKRKRSSDLDRVPNETNYNINSMDEEVLESISAEEAKTMLEEMQKGEAQPLSHRDFYALKRKIEQDG